MNVKHRLKHYEMKCSGKAVGVTTLDNLGSDDNINRIGVEACIVHIER